MLSPPSTPVGRLLLSMPLALTASGPTRSADRLRARRSADLVLRRLTNETVSSNLPFVVTNQEADGLSVLGDRTRRAIFESLSERPRAVGELADELPVSRPAVSQHLKVLKSAGLVTEHAAGTRRIYRLNPEGVAALRDQLDTYWNRALSGYAQATEDQPEEKS